MTQVDSKPRRGRPRSEEAHQAILAATLDEIRASSYEALSIEAVAARAGVGKTTIYRRWSTREALVAAALEGLARRIPVPDTGTVRGDVMAVLESSRRIYADPASRGLLAALVAAMSRSEMVERAIRDGFVAARRETFLAVLRRGVKRGELRRSADLEVAVDLLTGPMLVRALLTGAPVTQELARRTADMVLRALERRPNISAGGSRSC